jgi:hypothetical protein
LILLQVTSLTPIDPQSQRKQAEQSATSEIRTSSINP